MPRKCSSCSAAAGVTGAAAARSGAYVGSSLRERRPLADLAEREAPVDQLGKLGEDDGRMRRELDVEALCQLGDPGELVRHGRDHSAAQTLHAALEVVVGPVPLEIARPGEHDIRPADGEPLEHRDREHVLGPLGEHADGRVGHRFVAGDDQEPDRLRVRLLFVGGRGPRVGDATGVRRRRQVEGGAAGLAVEPQLVRELREPGAPAAATARPDQNGAVGGRHTLAELLAQLHVRPAYDLGAVAARLLEPELDDRGAVGDLVLADHDDDLGRRDRRQRRAKGVERPGRRLGHDGGVGAQPLAEQLRERVRLLDGLGAGERRDDPPFARRAAEPRRGRARRPRRARRSRGGACARADRRSGRRRRGAGTRSDPCRRASPGRPPGGSARGCA